jgi:hypothetical protein
MKMQKTPLSQAFSTILKSENKWEKNVAEMGNLSPKNGNILTI